MNQLHGIQFILNKGKNPLHYSNKAEKYMPQITSVADLLEKKKGAYAASLSTANRWAFWNSLSIVWKSVASFAPAIFLAAKK